MSVMAQELSNELQREQASVEAQIRRDFRGVRREGGVSWSQAEVLDGWGGDEKEMREALLLDVDISWETLVDDPTWLPLGESNIGYLDAIGFRYYIPAVLIRQMRDSSGVDLASVLFVHPPLARERKRELQRLSLLTQEQCRSVAHAIRFMIHAAEGSDYEDDASEWRETYESHWHQFG